MLLFLLVRHLTLGIFAEDALQACRVVLGLAVVVEDTILLLLDIGQLGVAVAPNLLANRKQCIHLALQTLVEILASDCRVAIAPRALALTTCTILSRSHLQTLNTAKLIKQIGLATLILTSLPYW